MLPINEMLALKRAIEVLRDHGEYSEATALMRTLQRLANGRRPMATTTRSKEVIH